jgi:hypothetical protein
MSEDEDEETRRRRADELRERIDDALRGRRPPRTPREFTDRAAAEAAEQGPEDDEED